MKHKKVVKINLVFILIMAISGLFFGFVTGSKSIITDGIVSAVIFVSSYVGIYVHSSLYPVQINDYPYGKWRFEYIYNLLRMITLLVIIGYSFIESIYIIFHYMTSGVVPKELILIEVLPYFVIKLGAVICSLLWLKKCYKYKDINLEEYTIEQSAVKVDGLLTFAILIGIVVFSHIAAISKIADAFTLLIVAVILGVSVFKELYHLVTIMIGKRVFKEQEKFIITLINKKHKYLHIYDVYLEKHGVVSMIYIQCSYDYSMTSEQFQKLQQELKSYFILHGIEKPMIHFNFDDNSELYI